MELKKKYILYQYLNGHFRVKHLLAESATVEVVSVQVHQVFLEFIRFGEEFHTALAAVLRGSSQEVVGYMLR